MAPPRQPPPSRVLPLVAALLLLAAAAQPSHAQLSMTADVGAATLHQAEIERSSVVTGGAELRWLGLRGGLGASGLAARTPDARWTAQGVLGAALFLGDVQAPWELAGSATAFGKTNDLPTTSLQGVLRRHLALGRVGVALGIGGATTEREGGWRGATLADATVAARLAGARVSLAGSYTATTSELRVFIPGAPVYRESLPVRYGDAVATWERDTRAVTLSAVGGARFTRWGGAVAPWGAGNLAWWATPRVAVVAAVGRALEDVVRGVPGARYASLGARVALTPRVVATRAPTPVDAPQLTVSAAPVSATDVGLAGTDGSGTARRIAVRVARAERVELMADFTGWEPVALAPSGAWWTVERAIAPGSHRVAIRIDGGAWLVPANLPRIGDDFGGEVGLLTVP